MWPYTICDIYNCVKEANSKNLVELFVEQVVLYFGIMVLVVDADRFFLHLLKDMCAALDVIWSLLRGSCKGLSVEIYHWVLNKNSNNCRKWSRDECFFIGNSMMSQYIWNSAPIENTNIPRCVAAVGRHFQFPIDVDSQADPSINCDEQLALYSYLKNVYIDS